MPTTRSFEADLDHPPARSPAVKAGLRVLPRNEQPPGTFVAIEIAVLVFVVALAMVAIIVLGTEDGPRTGAGSGAPSASTGLHAPTSVGRPDRADALDARAAR